jgi:hypothetical protein
MADRRPDILRFYQFAKEHTMSDKENLGSPYASVYTAGNDQYHAVASINEFGPIKHTAFLAKVLVEKKAAQDEWEALQMAHSSVNQAKALANGDQYHKLAHVSLQQEAKRQREHAGPVVVPNASRA